jgi:hypothetical protein
MTFLNPAILFGLLAVGLPVLIHLLSKPQLRRIRWAANRFLFESVQKNRRRIRAEDILLLVLRSLLVVLLVLIFARPAFLMNASDPQAGREATTAVILLDDSESMGQSDGIQTRFDQTKTMIDGIISQLAPGSAGALFLVSDRVKAVVPKPTLDLSVLRRTLKQSTLTDRGTDLYPGIKQAVYLLKSATGRREIFVLTDSHLPAWSEIEKIRQLRDEHLKDITMHFIVVGEKGEDNLAVSGLETIGTVSVVNLPLRCAIRVSNFGKSSVQNVPVKLTVDGEAPQDQGMIDQLDPGASKVVNLFVRFREPGYHSITASIPGDRMPADNQRSVALLVLEQVRALIVEGTVNPEPTARDGFFLRQALVPVRPEEVDQYFLKATVGQVNDLDSTAISQYEMVFLSNVPQLNPLGAKNLQQYVENGGALVVFPGPATDLNYFNNNTNLSALLPATLGAAQEPSTPNKTLGWQGRDYQHPVTALWNDPESGNLGSVRVSKYFPLTLKADASSAAQVVVKYADGEPAVVAQPVGKGKVFLFSSTATTDWSTLPVHPAFVPLLMRIMAYAASGSGGKLDLTPGQSFAFEVGSEYAGRNFSVITPGAKERRIVGSVEAGERSAVLRYSDTDQGGAYQLFIGDEPKPKVVFAVLPDPAESDLTQEPKSVIAPLLAVSEPAARPAGGMNETPKTKPLRVPGPEIWYPLVLAALLLALLETALAHRFSQSK